jgi:hypothetical protein
VADRFPEAVRGGQREGLGVLSESGYPWGVETHREMNDDLQPEYDLRTLLQEAERGKYVERYKAGTNLVLLDPDVAKVFPDEKSVNEALRLVIELTKISAAKKRRAAKA